MFNLAYNNPKHIFAFLYFRQKRYRRRFEDGINPTNVNDISLIFSSLLQELHAWLSVTLRDGRLIPLTDVQQHYQQIMKNYNSNNGICVIA